MNYNLHGNIENFELIIFILTFCVIFTAVMTVMAISIDEIRESINMARDMALTGNYDSSIVYYEGAKLQLGRFLSTLDNQTRRESWRTVSNISP